MTADNNCCPKLLIVDCADTDEHKHLVCGFSKAILENSTVCEFCVGGYESCVLRKDVS